MSPLFRETNGKLYREVTYNIKNKMIAMSFQQSDEDKRRIGNPWGKDHADKGAVEGTKE